MARCDSYAFGNCTRGACLLATWVPEGLGDGGDWAVDALERGYQVTMIPTVGSVMCYCRGDGYSQWGHVAVVLDVGANGMVLVREMNYTAFNAYDDRWSTLGDLCGFILAPGMTPGQSTPGQGSGGGGSPVQVPGALFLAWDNVRTWTHNTADELAGAYLTDANLASSAGG